MEKGDRSKDTGIAWKRFGRSPILTPPTSGEAMARVERTLYPRCLAAPRHHQQDAVRRSRGPMQPPHLVILLRKQAIADLLLAGTPKVLEREIMMFTC